MAKLFNRAKMTTSTTGTGTITLGSASTGFQTFADAGVSDGDVVQYVIEEGANFEIGTGTYTASGTTLSRTPSESSNSDAAITLAGAAQVAITAVASQIGGGDRDLSFDDNAKAKFGASDDLQIFHDGTHTYIDETNPTGYLFIRGANTQLLNPSNEIYLECNNNGSVDFYHDNSKKLATTSTGISVTGNATFADNGKAIFGAGSDLQIYHDGSNSYVQDAGAGSLLLRGTNLSLQANNGENFINCTENGEILLRHNNFTKLATTATGVDVTGTVTADGLTVETTSGTVASFYDDNAGVIKVGNNTATTGNTASLYLNHNSLDGVRITSEAKESFADAGSRTADLTVSTRHNGNLYDRINVASSGDISFYEDTGTTPKFFWDASAESLGIGTGSPQAELHLSTASTPEIRLTDTTNSVEANFFANDSVGTIGSKSNHAFVFNTNNTERMRIDSSGRVGIGTSSPTQALEVRGSVRIGAGSQDTSDMLLKGNTGPAVTVGGSTEAAIITTTGVSGGAFHVGIEVPSNDSNDGFYVATDANNDGVVDTLAMKINAAGNVGIGTSSPSYELEVYGRLHSYIDGTSDQTSFGTTTSGGGGYSIKADDYTAANPVWQHNVNFGEQFAWRISGTERMRIDSSGNVGIGTSSPSQKLEVSGSSGDVNAVVTTTGASNQAGLTLTNGTRSFRLISDGSANALRIYDQTAGTERMRIDSSGRTLLRTSSVFDNAYTLQVQVIGSTGGIIIEPEANNYTAMRFNNDSGTQVGDIVAGSSSTSYNTSSDHRLKENVVDLTGATTRLKQLEPKRFNFIVDADTTVDGFLAHEVQSVVPEAITGTHNEVDADGNPVYQGIDQSKLVPLLVATIKELEARITSLENA